MKRIKGIPLRFTRNSLSVAIAIASGILDEEQRYFTDLTAAGGQYYSLSNDITLTGDFEIEIKFSANLGNTAILGKDDINSSLFYLDSSGFPIFRFGDGVNKVGSQGFIDDFQHTAIISRTGSAGNMIVDGFSEFSGLVSTDDVVLNLIGNNQFNLYFNGIISDLKIWTNGDRNTGTLIADFPLDEDWTNGNVAVNRANPANNATAENITDADAELFTQEGNGDWLGEELITQAVWENPFNAEDQWSFANNQWSLTGDGSLNSLRLLATANQPNVMRLSGNCPALSGVLATANTGGVDLINSAGFYSFDIDRAAVDSQLYKRFTGTVNATLDKPSLKRLLETA